MTKMSFTVKTKGLAEFGRAKTRIETQSMRVMSEWASNTERETALYPPPPSGSTYRRTGALGAGWRSTTQRTGSGITSKVTNSVEYAKYVHGGKFGYIGWLTLDDVAESRWETAKKHLSNVFKP